jgi:phosphoribosyl 1,2-cyclic phosphate phosphodiesterase
MSTNKITLLGTGTSVGIPMVGCKCIVCKSDQPKNKRLRTSAYIEYEGKNFLIDIGPDFRQQMLKNQIESIDAILITHPHFDHIGGYDDIRGFNFSQEKPIKLFTNHFSYEALKKQFYYVFEVSDYPSLPSTEFKEIKENTIFQYESTEIKALGIWHGKMPCLGFRFGNLAYLTDVNDIPEPVFEDLQNLDVLILDALRIDKHPSHFSLEESIEIAKKINAKKTVFIHISHHMGLHEEVSKILPKNISLGYDSQIIYF